jgi:hypothetical protein
MVGPTSLVGDQLHLEHNAVVYIVCVSIKHSLWVHAYRKYIQFLDYRPEPFEAPGVLVTIYKLIGDIPSNKRGSRSDPSPA